MMREVRYVLRSLIRRPVFTALVLVTLGIGIGASTAIFSVVEAVLLRPLPFKDPDRLVFVWNRMSATGVEKSPVAGPDYVDYVTRTRLFEGIAGFNTAVVPLTDDVGHPQPVTMTGVTHNFFSVLGVELVLGEMFGPEDEPRGTQVATLTTGPAVISYGLWQRRYGGDPGVLGRTINARGQAMVIRGVAPPGFRLHLPPAAGLPERTDLFGTFPIDLAGAGRVAQFVYTVGRLKPGVSLSDAQGEMDRIAAWQRENFGHHQNVGMEIRVVPMHEDMTRHVRPFLLLLLLASGLLLVLTFSNVTNLLLVRSWGRRREVSIRAALGGRPRQLVVQVLAESTLLAFLGGALGVLFAHWGIRLLLALQPEKLPRLDEVGLGAPVLLAALGMVLVTALACGVVPALQASRLGLAAALSERSATGTAVHHWLRKFLVIAEIAISLVLLIGTGLIVRSFLGLTRVDTGFKADNVLTARVTLPIVKYPPGEQAAVFFDQLLARAAAIPGVEHAGAAFPIPLEQGRQYWIGPWAVAGMDPDRWRENEADFRAVMPGYFEAMGMQRLGGRFFTAADNRPEARPVAIVDEILARRAWPDEKNPVGKQLTVWNWDDTGNFIPVPAEVVGLIRHVRDADLTRDSSIGTIYCPYRLYSVVRLTVTLRSATADPMSLVEPLREAVASIDASIPLIAVRPMQAYVDDFLAPTRFALVLIGVFAVVATVLAAVGLYGVISSTVQERTREIGVRMAFGATRGNLVGMVLRQSLGLACWGLAAGLVAALLLTRGFEALLFGVTPTDSITFAAIVVVQGLIAVLASLVPAWRAARVDPVTVLASE